MCQVVLDCTKGARTAVNDVRSALSSEDKCVLLAGLLEEKARQPLHARLSPGQMRLWQLQLLEPNNPVYNISIAYRLDTLDAGALEQAVRDCAATKVCEPHLSWRREIRLA